MENEGRLFIIVPFAFLILHFAFSLILCVENLFLIHTHLQQDLKLNLSRRNNLAEGTQLVKRLIFQRRVSFDDGHCLAAALTSSEMKAADVHFVLA